MFHTNVVEKLKTRILCWVTFFFFFLRKSCRLLDNAGKNIVEPDRTHTTVWRMFIACWIPKSTNTHSE